MPTLRVKYGKDDSLKCLSHLEVMRTVERTVRRADLPFVLTAGKSPHLKIAYGPPLPVGFSSRSEFFDLEMKKMIPLKDVIKAINRAFPAGLSVIEARYLPPRTSSLSAQTVAASYEVVAELEKRTHPEEIKAKIRRFMAADRLRYEHRGISKEAILNEAVFSFSLDKYSAPRVVFKMTLALGNVLNIRPEQFLVAFDDSQTYQLREICRTGLYGQKHGKLLDLISL